MGYDTGIANRLRAAGLNVVEVAGWQNRGSSSFNPRGFVWHHTAGPRNGNSPSLNICIYGRSGLPGPLCNVFQARDNTIYVVAAGRANHAGTGGWNGLSGNSSVYGLEIENVGTPVEPWRLDQLDVAARVAAALLGNPGMSCHHKEWTSRKIDMHSVGGPEMRAHTGAVMAGGKPHPGPPVDLAAIAAGIAEARKHTLRQGDRNDHVKWAQAGINNISGRGLTVDGHFGPATDKAVRDLQKFLGMPVTGVVDGAVWSILFDPKPAPAPAPAPPASAEQFLKNLAAAARAKPTLRQGSKGEGVRDLQRHLNGSMGRVVAEDAMFGPGTANAVRRYQRSKGLGVDGVVGFNTWVQLIADAISRLR